MSFTKDSFQDSSTDSAMEAKCHTKSMNHVLSEFIFNQWSVGYIVVCTATHVTLIVALLVPGLTLG